jgi:N-methylhydantoinase B/oxoprolinase/acetone carboxylase alpha subunit
VKIAVDVTFDGKGEVEIDFSRSSDTVPAAINSYINYTRAYALFAIKVFCDALQPQTEGSIRPITVTAREGSFFNPSFPRRRAAERSSRSASSTRSTERSPKRCRTGRWAPSHIGRIRISAASTTGRAGRS